MLFGFLFPCLSPAWKRGFPCVQEALAARGIAIVGNTNDTSVVAIAQVEVVTQVQDVAGVGGVCARLWQSARRQGGDAAG